MPVIKIIKNNSLILFLLLLASVLRLYNFFGLEYTYDELSALNRIEYSSFSELIAKGVKLDAHPALIQVFLYYYCKLFGITEWIVKLPFIISGIWSVYLVYSIGKRWFSETSGLLAAALITCSQYFVFYSVIARPYISGTFLCLLVLKYWLEILFDEKVNKKQYLLFALFAALSALNHHFSMMFAALCGIIGVFFISKKNAKYYILSCVAAISLYTPHFPIFFYQLSVGGIGTASGGWLSAPENDFIVNFLFYLFHYSYLFVVTTLAVIAFLIIKNKTTSNKQQLKIRLSLLLLFIISFLIGFIYSQKVNPVIQFSTLIFATPCLLLFMTSFVGETKLPVKWLAMSALIIVGISTLVMKRKYYQLVFNQSFDTYMQTADRIANERGNENVYCLFKGEPWFLNFYKKKYKSDVKYKVIENEALSLYDYKSIYDTLQSKYLILGDFSAPQLYQATIYYPYVCEKIIGYGYELYVLSKERTDKKLDIDKELIATTNFEHMPEAFSYSKDLVVKEKGEIYYRVDSLNEYPISYKSKDVDMKCKEGHTILMEIAFDVEKATKGLLCGSTDANNQNVHWAAEEMEVFYNAKSHKQKAYAARYVDAKFNASENEFKVFVWNNKKEQFKLSNLSIYKWNNNPYRYGLLSDF